MGGWTRGASGILHRSGPGRTRATLATALAALTVAVSLALAPGAWAHEGGLELSIEPSELAAGETVTVTGEGFGANATVELRLTGPGGDAELGEATTNEEGEFEREIIVPGTTVPGLYLIRAEGDEEATAELTVGAMAGMAPPVEEPVAERERSTAWQVAFVVLLLGLGALGLVVARPRRPASERHSVT